MREMLISVQMEKKYSKQEILQGYLNIAQFGTNSLYGVQAAAERYFNTTADKLNIVQAATIAMITKNPSKYDPSIPENREEAQKQRNIVLELMKNQHFITQAEYEEAVKTPLVDTLHITPVSRGCMAAKYNTGFFCDYVVHRIENSPEFGKTAKDRERLLQEGGLQIVTTLDLDASNALMDVANKTIPANDSSGMEIVMASVKPGTGEVLGFGLNRAYDATDAAAHRPDEVVDELRGRSDRRRRPGLPDRLLVEADQPRRLDAAGDARSTRCSSHRPTSSRTASPATATRAAPTTGT